MKREVITAHHTPGRFSDAIFSKSVGGGHATKELVEKNSIDASLRDYTRTGRRENELEKFVPRGCGVSVLVYSCLACFTVQKQYI